MISFAVGVLNVILWIWFIGAVFSFPFAMRFVLRTNDTIKVEDVVLMLLSLVGWFMCLEDLTDEIDDTFGLTGDKTVSAIFNKIMDYDLITIHRL